MIHSFSLQVFKGKWVKLRFHFQFPKFHITRLTLTLVIDFVCNEPMIQ
jgi:hypothetical protein